MKLNTKPIKWLIWILATALVASLIGILITGFGCGGFHVHLGEQHWYGEQELPVTISIGATNAEEAERQ